MGSKWGAGAAALSSLGTIGKKDLTARLGAHETLCERTKPGDRPQTGEREPHGTENGHDGQMMGRY